jgi:4-diphosphocytidyl-2C-methyl-D-erythritol kinase
VVCDTCADLDARSCGDVLVVDADENTSNFIGEELRVAINALRVESRKARLTGSGSCFCFTCQDMDRAIWVCNTGKSSLGTCVRCLEELTMHFDVVRCGMS